MHKKTGTWDFEGKTGTMLTYDSASSMKITTPLTNSSVAWAIKATNKKGQVFWIDWDVKPNISWQDRFLHLIRDAALLRKKNLSQAFPAFKYTLVKVNRVKGSHQQLLMKLIDEVNFMLMSSKQVGGKVYKVDLNDLIAVLKSAEAALASHAANI